jgi:hypothetical protein
MILLFLEKSLVSYHGLASFYGFRRLVCLSFVEMLPKIDLEKTQWMFFGAQ